MYPPLAMMAARFEAAPAATTGMPADPPVAEDGGDDHHRGADVEQGAEVADASGHGVREEDDLGHQPDEHERGPGEVEGGRPAVRPPARKPQARPTTSA